MAVQTREAIDDIWRKVQRLADFAHGAAAAIGDDVGGHGRAMFAIAAIDLLDHALATVAAGKVQIDVGPCLSAFAEEAFEEQIVGDRIASGDAEAVADDAIGRAAAPLHKNVILAAIVRDVPDNEKVAGEAEAPDQVELEVQLLEHLCAEMGITRPRSGKGHCAQKGIHRFAGRHRIFWKFVAEILE